MSAFERKSSVSKFVKKWSERGYEKGEAQPFWLSLLRDVFNIDEPEEFISFEVPIPHGFIDGLIVSTKTLIEQKSSSVNLDDEEIFKQAKRYNDALEYSRKARWIITCNFKEFRVFDMDKRYPERDAHKKNDCAVAVAYGFENFGRRADYCCRADETLRTIE